MGYVERSQFVFRAVEVVDQAAYFYGCPFGVAFEACNRFVIDNDGLYLAVTPVDLHFGFGVDTAYAKREGSVVLYPYGNVVVVGYGDEYGCHGYIFGSDEYVTVDALAVHFVIAQLITFGRRGSDIGRYARFERVVFNGVQFV